MLVSSIYGRKRRTKARIGTGASVDKVQTKDVGYYGTEVIANERNSRES